MKTKPPYEVLERKVQQQEKMITDYERLFNLAPDMICTARPDGYFEQLNPAFKRILGYSLEEIASSPLIDFVHPDDRDDTIAEVEKQLNGRPVRHFENRYRTKHGAYRRLQWNATESIDGRLYAVARDITDSERLKSALNRRNAILNTLSVSTLELLKTTHMNPISINKVIAAIGQAADVSRAYIGQHVITQEGEERYTQRYEWVAEGISRQLDNPAEQNAEYPNMEDGYHALKMLRNGEVIHVIVADLPNGPLKTQCTQQNITTYLLAPIFVGNHYWGYIGFDECRQEREWSQGEIDAIVTVAALLGAMLERIGYEQRLHQEVEEKTKTLAARAERMKEMNHALSVVMKKREQDRIEIEEGVVNNARSLIQPYIDKLKSTPLNELQKAYLGIIQSNIDEITAPMINRLGIRKIGLTPMELKVANLIKIGLRTKQIAEACNASRNTVNVHRKHIRRKLNITNSKINLRTALLNII